MCPCPRGRGGSSIRAVDERDNDGAPGVLVRPAPGSDGAGGAGGFVPVTRPGAVKRKAKPRLTLKLKARRGARNCVRGRVQVTVGGADLGLVKRANLRLGKQALNDAKRPLSKRFTTRALRRSHVRQAKASLRLRDGRLVRLSKRFRVCARR